jgi:L-serine dehydratase
VQENNLRVAELMLANEKVWRSEDEIRAGLMKLWRAMQACVEQGLKHEGILPGGLNVRRRAAKLHRSLQELNKPNVIGSTLSAMEWVNLFALAVNEENAAGGHGHRAHQRRGGDHSGGAALLHEIQRRRHRSQRGRLPAQRGGGGHPVQEERLDLRCRSRLPGRGRFGLRHGRRGACRDLGATPEQLCNAAEIGLEHNLGLTCDPVGGLVQVPCIERNAIAAVKAINAAQMALRGDGQHFISLDRVIRTMRDTGADMHDKYKETSRGGLAVSAVEC